MKGLDKIVVDDWKQVVHHGVDVAYRGVKEGIISENDILELGKIITKQQEGRTHKDDKIIFNPIGLGIHDLSEAHRIYQNAKSQNIGQTLNLWEQPIL